MATDPQRGRAGFAERRSVGQLYSRANSLASELIKRRIPVKDKPSYYEIGAAAREAARELFAEPFDDYMRDQAAKTLQKWFEQIRALGDATWVDVKDALPKQLQNLKLENIGSAEVLACVYTKEGEGYLLIASLNHENVWVTGEDFTRLVEYSPGIKVRYWMALPKDPVKEGL